MTGTGVPKDERKGLKWIHKATFQGYQLDFNTTNYFTRYVKRVLGMTPSQYKAKLSVKK